MVFHLFFTMGCTHSIIFLQWAASIVIAVLLLQCALSGLKKGTVFSNYKLKADKLSELSTLNLEPKNL